MATLKENSAALAALSEKVRSLPKRPELVEVTLSPSAEDVVAVPESGKAFSKVTVEGDSNLVAENIAEGVSIFGVTGTHVGGGDLDALIERTLTSVSSGAKNVGSCAFYANSSISSVDFPNAKSIGGSAFYGCDVLKNANIPNATSIDTYAFYGCRNLTSADFPKVTWFGNYAFNGCTLLTSINFPNVMSVGGYAFYGCSKITDASFPNATSLGESAFYNCSVLRNANIPNAMGIAGNTFYNCSALTSVNLPSATVVSPSAFRNCSKLTSVDIQNATTIDSYAFRGCSALVDIDLPKVTSIASAAFRDCYQLKSVVLRSETVCSLSQADVFQSCYHILGTVNSTYNPNGDKDGYIYVPANLVSSYKAATNWSTFASQIRAIPGEEGTQLPTPEIMVDVGDLYINNIASATSVSIYWCYEGEEPWNLLAEPTIAEGTEQEVFLSSTLSEWVATNGFLPGDSITLSVIAHADGYEDSERSNEVTFTVPY